MSPSCTATHFFLAIRIRVKEKERLIGGWHINPRSIGKYYNPLVVSVRYHCGGWSEEVNSCILISYMVYL